MDLILIRIKLLNSGKKMIDKYSDLLQMLNINAQKTIVLLTTFFGVLLFNFYYFSNNKYVLMLGLFYFLIMLNLDNFELKSYALKNKKQIHRFALFLRMIVFFIISFILFLTYDGVFIFLIIGTVSQFQSLKFRIFNFLLLLYCLIFFIK